MTKVVVVQQDNIIQFQKVVNEVVVTAPGPQGAPGHDGANGNAFEWTQSSPSASWVINHNLNKYPCVTVADDTMHVVFPDVQYSDLNNVAVVFPAPATGSAHLV